MNNEQTQDLRERANAILLGVLDTDNSGRLILNRTDIITAMLQFAAEVAGEKDRGISELEKKLKDQNSMIADLWETIDESNQRIAELEAELLRCKDQAEVYGNATVNAMDSVDELQKRIAELEREIERLKEKLTY